MHEVLNRIGQLKIIPVVSLDDAADASPLADALSAGGLPIIEITFRTSAAEEAIRSIAKRSTLLIGAGTVLNVDTAKRAVDAGAAFIVSPGFNPKVVDWCLNNRVPITPGVVTPTEVEMALDHGLTAVKFFPAEPLGGMTLLKALAAVYGMMHFIPTGGITTSNIEPYLKFDKVLAVGGSWMASKELIKARQFDRVRELSEAAVQLVDRIHPTRADVRKPIFSAWQINEMEGR